MAEAVVLCLVGIITVYRVAVSPALRLFFRPCCRFAPSCSAYAIEALKKHGALKGVALSAARIGRCHPWGGQGHDPVP